MTTNFETTPGLPRNHPDVVIRTLLKKHGGSVHGPRVETVSIPEAAFFRFLSEFAATVKETPDAF